MTHSGGRLIRAGVLALVTAVGGVPAVATSASPAADAGATAAIALPPANGQFDYQLGGAYKPAAGVRIVDRDRTSHPAIGIYNVCYINAFQTQAYQAKWWRSKHPSLLLRDHGRLVQDPGWPGEYLLDTATKHLRAALAKIEGRWIDGCRAKGFDAVEPDNLDSNTRSHHLLTQADNFGFAKLFIDHAHRVGLAVAQKNSAEQSGLGAKTGFDFAIAEECQAYHECGHYASAYGDEVFEIEYTDNGADHGEKIFKKACATRGSQISIILRDRNVTPRGSRHYFYESC